MSKFLRNLVDELKATFKPKEIDYGRIYDAIRQIDLCTSPKRPDQTQDEWEEQFIQRSGTREEFISKQTKR
jgi:hypothetical protein